MLFGRTMQHRTEIYTTHSGDGRMNVYPIRAVRTDRFKYVRNLFPQNQYTTHIDRSPNETSGLYYWRTWVAAAMTNPDAASIVRRYHERPAEELYDLVSDPAESHNLADNPQHAATLKVLREKVDVWMKEQGDQGQMFNEPYPLGNAGIDGHAQRNGRSSEDTASVVENAKNKKAMRRPSSTSHVCSIEGLWEYTQRGHESRLRSKPPCPRVLATSADSSAARA